MDAEEKTPRNGRKKKSTLSRLAAAKGKRHHSEDGDLGSMSSVQDSVSGENGMPRYPIDARVEIRPNVGAIEEDSDEGIEVANDTYSSLERTNNGSTGVRKSHSRSPHLDNGNHVGSSASDHTSNAEEDNEDYESEKRDLQPGISGKDRVRDSGMSRGRKEEDSTHRYKVTASKSDTESDVPVNSNNRELAEDYANNVDRARQAIDLDYNSYHRHNAAHPNNKCKDFPTVSVNSTVTSNLLRGSRSKSDDDLTGRYRDTLTKAVEKDESDLAEREEMADNISALRQQVGTGTKAILTSTMRASTTSSLFGSTERPWASLNKFSQFDTLSQRSFQSTSVLPLITTREARNRSFLVGSISGRAALMGIEEMERFFPDHKIRIFVGTWNMCDMKLLPDTLDDWLLPDSTDYIQDMYIIGTQESCTNRKEWEIRLQETLGPSHVLFHTVVHGVLYLCVFLRRDLIWFCSVHEEATVTTRVGPTNVATKGAAALCFTFFGTSFLFINSHLTPHDGKVKERISDYNKIISSLNLPKVVLINPYSSAKEDTTSRFDCVFWMGDLNFRLDKERDRVDNAVQGMESQEMPSYEDLMRHDELFRVRNEGLAFQEFQEGRIKFKPTYKYDRGTDNYDTSKKMRIPSYTDRVLFRSKKKNSITCLHYDSVNAIKDSDHKPVFSLFEVNIRPGKDNIPLAAGQFNREVWLEGNKRRAERLESQRRRAKSSTVCSIQ